MSQPNLIDQIKQGLKGRQVIIVSDTDGHGICLAAAYLRAIKNLGVPENAIAVIQHFDFKGPATTARGDVPAVLKAIAEGMEPGSLVIITDVPAPMGREEDYVAALKMIAQKARKVVHIDHVSHSPAYAKLTDMVVGGNIELGLESTAFSMFKKAITLSPTDPEILELAILGAIMDADYDSVVAEGPHYLQLVKYANPSADVAIPSIDDIKAKYEAILAVDTYMKFGKVPTPQTKVAMIGNVAHKSVYLASVGVRNFVREAMNSVQVPSRNEVMKDVEIVNGLVAVYKKIAPPGQGFKYASLIDAATDVPVIVVPAIVGKGAKVLILAPESFDHPTKVRAKEFLVSRVKEIFDYMVQKGWSDPNSDVPRGAGAYSVGVSRLQSDEQVIAAARELAEFVAKKLVEFDVSFIARSVAKETIGLLVADEKAAAAVVRLIEAVTRPVMEEVKKLREEIKEIRERSKQSQTGIEPVPA